ncbi:AsmA family protein [Zavarzinia sp. CC-PAN008]|uniref:AsmA family protein n=1 Tax=Zavarzinia sp. CC-PAN008 TaxID=3243332 RepID=UPI003F74AA3C
MRWILIGLAALLVTLLGAALVAPALIDLEARKPMIVDAVEQATGRSLALDGPIDFAILPRPHFTAQTVRLANPAGGPEGDFVTLKQLRVTLSPLPLLSGRIDIQEVELVEPVIALERSPTGAVNWTMTPRPADPAATSDGPQELRVSELKITGGTAIWRDGASGSVERAEQIQATMSADTLRGPFKAQGTLVARGQTLGFTLALGALAGNAQTTAMVALDLGPGAAALRFDGTAGSTGANGSIAISSTNLAKALAPLTGSSPPILAAPLQIDGRLDLTPARAVLSDLVGRLGDNGLTGRIEVVQGDPVEVTVALKAPRLDLDRILSAAGTGSGTAAATDPATPTAAMVLPGGIAAQIELAVDAIAFRNGVIQQAQLNAALADGRLTLNAAGARLPGGTDLALAGAVEADGRFAGTVDLASDNFRGLAAWAGIDTSAVPADRLTKVELTGRLGVNNGRVDLSQADLKVDASRIQGNVALIPGTAGGRAKLGLDLALDSLNLDAYMGARASGAVAPPDAGGTPGGVPQLPFDLDLTLKAGQFAARGVSVNGLDIAATLESDTLRLGRLAAADAAGARVAASGTVTGLATAQPTLDLKVDLANPSVRKLAADLGANLAGTADSPVSARLDLAGSLPALDAKGEIRTAGAEFSIAGKVSGLPLAMRPDIAIKVYAADAAPLFALVGGQPPAPGALSFDARLTSGPNVFILDGMAAQMGTFTLGGTARVDTGGSRPRVEAELKAGPIDLRGSAPAAGTPRAQGIRSAERWSREPLPLEVLRAIDLQLKLAVERIDLNGLTLAQPSLQLSGNGAQVALSNVRAGLYGGQVTAAGQVDLGPSPPTMALEAQIAGASLEQIQGAGAQLTGTLDARTSVRAAGQSPFDLVSTLAGTAEATAANGAIRGADLPRLSQQLDDLRQVPNLVAMVATATSSGQTPYRSIRMTFGIEKGIATITSFAADIPAVSANASGAINLPAWTIAVTLDAGLSAHPEAPRVAVDLGGPLDAPGHTVRTQQLESWLAQKAVELGLGGRLPQVPALDDLPGQILPGVPGLQIPGVTAPSGGGQGQRRTAPNPLPGGLPGLDNLFGN